MIYIITRQPFPNGMAGTNRIKCYARALHHAGVPCEILIFSRDARNAISKGEIEGVPFRYIFNFCKRWPGRMGGLQTSIMMVGLYLYLLFKLQKGDIVFEYARESYRFINRVISLTHFKKAKFVSELCEVPGLGFTHKEAVQEKDYIVTKLFPRYDGVIAISEKLEDYAKAHANLQCRVIKVPVLVDVEEFRKEGERPVSEPYIFYSGSYDDQKDGTIGMFEAFRQVSKKYDKPLKFVCTGKRNDYLNTGYLKEPIEDEDLSKCLIFTGYLSHEKIVNYLFHCEMVVSARYTNEQTMNGFSTKLAEYAAAGKALVLTPVGEAANWFHDGVDCLMVPEREPNTLADAILKLLENKREIERIGAGLCQMCIQSFDFRAWSKPLKGLMESLSI